MNKSNIKCGCHVKDQWVNLEEEILPWLNFEWMYRGEPPYWKQYGDSVRPKNGHRN